jgi:hypothetical protein
VIQNGVPTKILLGRTTMGQSDFVTVGMAAYHLELPSAWLRSEAEAGRIPAFRANRRLFCSLEAVRAALASRTVNSAEPSRETVAV